MMLTCSHRIRIMASIPHLTLRAGCSCNFNTSHKSSENAKKSAKSRSFVGFWLRGEGLLIIIQYFFAESLEGRNIGGCGLPDDLAAHASIMVCYQVAHPLHRSPLNAVGGLAAKLLAQSGAQFPDLQDGEGDGSLIVRVGVKDSKTIPVAGDRALDLIAIVTDSANRCKSGCIIDRHPLLPNGVPKLFFAGYHSALCQGIDGDQIDRDRKGLRQFVVERAERQQAFDLRAGGVHQQIQVAVLRRGASGVGTKEIDGGETVLFRDGPYDAANLIQRIHRYPPFCPTNHRQKKPAGFRQRAHGCGGPRRFVCATAFQHPA